MRRLIFHLTAADEAAAREITLNGVIDGKLARGEYRDVTGPDLDTLVQIEDAVAGERQDDRDETVMILLAGLGIESLAELKRLVDAGRAALPTLVYSTGFEHDTAPAETRR